MASSIPSYADTIYYIGCLAPGKKILGIGGGNDQFLATALEYGFEPTGVEPSESFAALCSEVLEVLVYNCRFEDFATAEGYDVITMGIVLENISASKVAVKKVYEHLYRADVLYRNP